MVTILVIRESSSSQLASDVVSFLLHALEAQSESPPIQQTALDCLLELELNLPVSNFFYLPITILVWIYDPYFKNEILVMYYSPILIQGLLTKNLNIFLSLMKNDDLLNHKAAEVVCTILKNLEKVNSSINKMEVNIFIIFKYWLPK